MEVKPRGAEPCGVEPFTRFAILKKLLFKDSSLKRGVAFFSPKIYACMYVRLRLRAGCLDYNVLSCATGKVVGSVGKG